MLINEILNNNSFGTRVMLNHNSRQSGVGGRSGGVLGVGGEGTQQRQDKWNNKTIIIIAPLCLFEDESLCGLKPLLMAVKLFGVVSTHNIPHRHHKQVLF